MLFTTISGWLPAGSWLIFALAEGAVTPVNGSGEIDWQLLTLIGFQPHHRPGIEWWLQVSQEHQACDAAWVAGW